MKRAGLSPRIPHSSLFLTVFEVIAGEGSEILLILIPDANVE
jgi:hypothetical protein